MSIRTRAARYTFCRVTWRYNSPPAAVNRVVWFTSPIEIE
jgi:hypothetical protein